VFFGMSLSPFLLRQSLTVMSDMSAIATCVFAYMQCARWLQDGRNLRLMWVLIALGLGLSFRLAVAPVAIAIVGWPVLRLLDARQRIPFSIAALLLVAAVLFMPAIALLLDLPVEDWSFLNLFRREHLSDDGALIHRMPNALYVLLCPLHPGFLPLGIVLFPFLRRSDWSDARIQLATIVFVGYALFVGGMPYQNDRVLLLGQPFALMIFWPAFQRAWARLEGMPTLRPIIWGCLLLVQGALSVRAIMPFIRQARMEREVVTRVGAWRPTQVYAHGIGAACVTYLPAIKVTELWQGEVERFASGAVIVGRPGDLHTQWEGLHPQRNWQKALEQGAREVDELEGWVLLRVRPEANQLFTP